MRRPLLFAALLVSAASPATAHKLIEPGPREGIAKGAYSARPETVWNRLGEKEGKYQEIWTIDGDQLNRLIFFGGVPDGEPLLKERNKKLNPLPKFGANMLLPDIPVLFERTYRAFYGSPTVEIGEMEPANIASHDGIRFTYRYVDVEDEVERTGEAVGFVKDKRLFVVAFEAPSLHYFPRDVDLVRRLVGTIALEK